MAANSSLDLVSLDFDTTKQSLKNYLKSQSIFKDYDFEGSNINILLDVLSYNTFMNSFYLNMVASESFLDSAQLRDSVISHAKELNYLPNSYKSAKVILEPFTVSLSPDTSSLVIPKGTRFSGTTKGQSRNFVTGTTYVNTVPVYDADTNTNIFSISNRVPDNLGNSIIVNPFELWQGNYQTDSFVVDYTVENQRFVLTDATVDTDSISVTVIENSGQNVLTYIYSATLLDVKNTDQKYFLQAAENGKYEVVFGDDIIGRRPRNNALVTIEYRTTVGVDGNGVGLFTLDSDVGKTSGGVFRGVSKLLAAQDLYPGGSSGGSGAESIDQIRFKAPRHFQTQERAVTSSDYAVLLQNQFPEIEAVAVFGGETLDPPLFGKVYVSVKLYGVEGLPDAKLQEYKSFLAPRSPLSIDTVFISPETLYYKITSLVNYNINVTSQRPDQIRASVINAITVYDATNLSNFNVTLRSSRLVNAIDTADSSIVSNDTSIKMYKKIIPFLGVSQNIVIRLGIPLLANVPALGTTHPANDIHAVDSSYFTYAGQKCLLEDDGDGGLRIITPIGNGLHKTVKDIGTVDYASGTITLTDFNIDSFDGTEIRIYGAPLHSDISTSGNNILELGTDELDISINTVRL